jgi:hypothetical protein
VFCVFGLSLKMDDKNVHFRHFMPEGDLVHISARTSTVLTEGVRGFSQSFQINPGLLS